MITIKDIARECNVSFSTVSKALQGSSEISKETTQFIKQKAEEMGYHPNIAARSLRTNKTYDIGVIFEDKTGAGLQHQYFAKILSGLQNEASKHGYAITLMATSDNTKHDYKTQAIARGFDGVAILSGDFEASSIKDLVFSSIPTITLDYVYDENHNAIVSDNEHGISELVNYIISKGHKKIAMIYGEDTLVTKERLSTFREICEKNGININSECLIQSRYNDPDASALATRKLIALSDRPSCILYPDDYSALGGIKELQNKGLIPGKNISITGYDGILLTSLLNPPLTTYEQDGDNIGILMARTLIENIENQNSFKASHQKLTGKLIEGGTVLKI